MRASLIVGLLFAGVAAAQDAKAPAARPPMELTSSRRDTTDPAVRDLPIRCKDGDLERAPGRSLGELFGDQWPAAPALRSDRRSRAGVVRMARVQWPKELYVGNAVVVAAVLVDAGGKPLRAEVLCASAAGLDMAVKRALLRSTYRSASFDGVPDVGVAMAIWSVHERDAKADALPLLPAR